MNKTVNINLAGLFFHIDENAYMKLQRYLAAIKRSFTDAQGRDEIIQDIEARIAELFSEKVQNERQVIGLKEVDEVIAVMGQPEDYQVDEEIFEDEPQPKTHYKSQSSAKKLYRDRDVSYVGGVCSGLGHYMGIDAIWVRILVILLTFLTSGIFILFYVVFWIFIPEAKTTSEKLEMRGKPVNIDNIQRKVKEGFENVADSVKSVDYEKYGNKAKRGATGFFATLGKIFMFIVRVFVKLFGILLILIGASSVIGLFIGLFTAGTLGVLDGGFNDYVTVFNTTGAPLWLISLLTLLAVGIPFFAIFYLGLKILVNNLKSMSLTAKLILVGLWFISLIALGVLAIRQATAYTVEGETFEKREINLAEGDTLRIEMVGYRTGRSNYYKDMSIVKDEDNNKALLVGHVRFRILESEDDKPHLEIIKSARGTTYDDAEENASQIAANWSLINGNELKLFNYFLLPIDMQFKDQEINYAIYLPEGAKLIVDDNTSHYHLNSSISGDLLWSGSEENLLIMRDGELHCDNCPESNRRTSTSEWKYSDEDGEYDFDASLKRQDGTAIDTDVDTTAATISDDVMEYLPGTWTQTGSDEIKEIDFRKDGTMSITFDNGDKIDGKWNTKPSAIALKSFPAMESFSGPDLYLEYDRTKSNYMITALNKEMSAGELTLTGKDIVLKRK